MNAPITDQEISEWILAKRATLGPDATIMLWTTEQLHDLKQEPHHELRWLVKHEPSGTLGPSATTLEKAIDAYKVLCAPAVIAAEKRAKARRLMDEADALAKEDAA